MPLANSNTHYGVVSKSFHWMTALLIVSLIPLGIYANSLPFEGSEELARKAWFFSLHKTLGITAFFVALARILWALIQPKPAHLHPDRKVETLAAATVHWLLYGSLLIVPLSGWIHHAATAGFAPIWWPFGQDLPLVPKSETLAGATAGLHIVFERVLAASIFLHLAGALKHHFFDRDATLRRMLPGTPGIEPPTRQKATSLPIVMATIVWCVALLTGAGLGLYGEHDNAVQAASLEAVQSDWVVQEGSLTIAVTQLGSQVTGTFSDWTADIRFDDEISEGKAGSVEVIIAIGSLTLGSVTSQAMGEDFFNTENFPIANFKAEIMATPEGYSTDGMLTIKDQTVPISLPMTLAVEDGTARLQADTTLDRRAFSIGAVSQPTESNLGFNVGVSVALTAIETEQ